MSLDLCRLCYTNENLSDIFVNKECINKYSAALYATTGLKINVDDGLPQKICKNCTTFIDTSLKFRNQCRLSELHFLKTGYKLSENNINYGEIDISGIQQYNEIGEPTEDSEDTTGFVDLQVEVVCDRLSENGEQSQELENRTKNIINPRNISRREIRLMYLDMVDGDLDPDGPVKCKICMKTVSKWACFISHAKLHLGFKFMCEFCGKSFISSTQLKRHCRSFHGMRRELACPRCNYLALDRAQLLVHERRVHTGERPFVCDSCGASYYSRRCLLQHLDSHRDTSTVQCPQCPALLKSRRHLARHTYSTHSSKNKIIAIK